jgi:hypothetical protein
VICCANFLKEIDMGGIVSAILDGGKSSAPPPPPPAPTVDNTAVTAAAADERKRRAAAEGRASTMLTQEAEGDEPMTAKKKLLGA